MTAEMPEQVETAPGAASVDFPWTHASSVLAALNALQGMLTSQLDARPQMVATLADWTGGYRDDFDVVLARLTTTATSLTESASSRASAVVTAAEVANGEQLVLNRRALLDSVSPFAAPTAGGGGGSW